MEKEDLIPQKTASLHPAYTVTNIQNKVRVLDGVKVTYSSWVKLFRIHARAYKVLDHIDGTRPPANIDDAYNQWAEIDAIVLQWIYGSLSDDLLIRVLEPDSTAFEAWEKIKNIFLCNKGSRAAALEHEFTNLTLQLVRGLPPEFDTAAAYINQTLPDWDTARSMLQLEHNRQLAREKANSSTAREANVVADHHQPNRSGRGPPFYRPLSSRQNQGRSNPRGSNRFNQHGQPSNHSHGQPSNRSHGQHSNRSPDTSYGSQNAPP
ncbi:uncharacterized protein LOC112504961 [Cynara cardunculus var. scolymus]|uniref:uncharacterized protein LOC112504961 n=1 Tax=Cynara cardunculus var. scolymus TaxID=59895 RepID=UPI000D62DB79|nr:uncharacterized protein LOC112504961 [Cynara cardunculus var. scolymus]